LNLVNKFVDLFKFSISSLDLLNISSDTSKILGELFNVLIVNLAELKDIFEKYLHFLITVLQSLLYNKCKVCSVKLRREGLLDDSDGRALSKRASQRLLSPQRGCLRLMVHWRNGDDAAHWSRQVPVSVVFNGLFCET